jgi:glycosyltransferase involved in cell wall biosynthesis
MKPSRVLHISWSDALGGSARSAYRIHQGLQGLGYESSMLVELKLTQDENVELMRRRIWRFLDYPFESLCERLDLQYLFYPSSFTVYWHRWFQAADIVQFYNIHGGYFSYSALPLLTRNKPAVWRLSDQWLFTGHCAYSYECERWKTGCGKCPHLGDYPSLKRDHTAFLWKAKKLFYKLSNFHLVAPSRWIQDLARQSPLLRHFPVHLIPNGIDEQSFRAIPKRAAREALGLPLDDVLVLHYLNPGDLKRKGGGYIHKAVKDFPDQSLNISLVTFGGMKPGEGMVEGIREYSLGSLKDERMLMLAFSAVDLYVLSPLAENLPNTILESMACGTPVVSWKAGGIAEIVRHLETGYLADYQDVQGLMQGIQLLVSDSELRSRLGIQARALIEKEYTQKLEASRFNDLYQGIMDQKMRRTEAIR